jgi:hypothetical protein
MRILHLLMLLLALALTACGTPADGAVEQSLVEQAAAEATAIVQRAQATALLLQAQAQATAVMAQVEAIRATSTPGVVEPAMPTDLSTTSIVTATSSTSRSLASMAKATQSVEIVRVGFAVDGGLIVIQFKAPPEVAEKWWQGSVKVIDEASGEEYREIPVMPKIGPLISKPRLAGQVGNVMLVNQPPGLKSGALVTVVLGDYTFEHILVE